MTIRKRYVALPGGLVSELPDDSPGVAELRKTDKRFAHAYDVTPKQVSVAVHVAIGAVPWWPHQSTPLRYFPCRACAGGAAAWLVCEECGGTRKVATLAWVDRPVRGAMGGGLG